MEINDINLVTLEAAAVHELLFQQTYLWLTQTLA
jgi:hypothetical protein